MIRSMSDRSKSEGAEGQEEAEVPAPQEPTTTPNTPPLPREEGSSEANPGVSNAQD